jgi:hypothetical protein
VNDTREPELNAGETGLVDCYHALAGVLAEHRDELAPYQQRNALKALGALWQIVNGLDLEPRQLYHLGA